MGEMLDHALELYELGLTVIPLGDPWSRPPPSIKGNTEAERAAAWCKRPRVTWETYQKTPPSEAQIRDWWTRWPRANIGVLTGVDMPGDVQLVVVDADSTEADGWLERSGEVASTPVMTQTARGRHRWYRMPKNLSITNASSSTKIDIRGVGGYVVAPGSTYGCGARNEWLVAPGWDLRDLDQLPELTAKDLGAIQRFGGHWGATDEHGDPRGQSPRADEDIIADLGAVRTPHDGSPVAPGGRNNALASLVGRWVQAGLSIQRVLQEAHRWNAGNPQPLPEHEVVATVTSILTTHTKNHGTRPQTSEPERKGRVEVFSWGDLEDAPPPLPETYWREGVLFQGARVLLAGPPKIGKSDMVIQFAMAAACGGELMGVHFERPLRVLWLQAEIHKGFLHQRLARLMHGWDDDERALIRQNFAMSGRMDLDLLDGEDFDLASRIVADHAPDVLIIDPIINFSSADENDNTEMRRLLRLVDVLSERQGCATVLVHHTRKDAAAGSFDSIRGASALRGWFDTGLLLTGQPGDAHAILSYELRNARAVPASTLERTEAGRFVPCQIDDEDAGESPEATVQGMRPGNAPRTKSHTNHTTSAIRKPTTITSESRNLTALEILSRHQPMSRNLLVEKLVKLLPISNRTANTIVSELAEEGRIRGAKVGRETQYVVAQEAPDTS